MGHSPDLELARSGGAVKDGPYSRTKEWLSDSSQHGVQLLEPNLDLSEELYQSLIDALQHLQVSPVRQGSRNILKDTLTRLFLWGREFRNGRLSLILCNAIELRATVLRCLEQIGDLTLALIEQDTEPDIPDRFQHLRTLLKQPSCDLDPDSGERRSEQDSPELAGRNQSVSAIEEAQQQSSDGDFSDDGCSIRSISTYDNDNYDLLETEVDCLMELLPSLEQSYAHLQLSWENPGKLKKKIFSVSEAALSFVQNVADRFDGADTTLVQRLGESNWQRFVTLRARRDQISQSAGEYIPELPVSAVYKNEPVPKSLFLPQTSFYDSGLGTSLLSAPSHAYSDASHTSFLSSNADDGESSFRVPKTPTAVSLGQPFNCEICGKRLHTIRNRVDWERHVFEDIQPYICTFPSCDKHLVKFATRSQWSDHEFNEHRVRRSWTCPECSQSCSSAANLGGHLQEAHPLALDEEQIPIIVDSAMSVQALPMENQECPLCQTVPGKSRRNFVKHLARHLESIALAALPADVEEDSDGGSVVSGASSKDSLVSEAFVGSSQALLSAQEEPIAESANGSTEEKKNSPFLDRDDDLKIAYLYRGFQKPIRVKNDTKTKGKWKCTLGCAWSHSDKGNWKRHERTHYPPAIWLCRHPDCSKKNPKARVSFRKDLIKRHSKSDHGADLDDNEIEKCRTTVSDSQFPRECVFDNCIKTFSSFDERSSHVEAHLEREDWLNNGRIVRNSIPDVELDKVQSNTDVGRQVVRTSWTKDHSRDGRISYYGNPQQRKDGEIYANIPSANIRARLKRTLSAMLEIEEHSITDGSSFEDLGMDSLLATELLQRTAKEFKVYIPMDEWANIRAMEQLVQYLDGKLWKASQEPSSGRLPHEQLAINDRPRPLRKIFNEHSGTDFSTHLYDSDDPDFKIYPNDLDLPDILVLNYRGIHHRLEFPPCFIDKGLLLVGQLRRYAAEKLDAGDPQRIQLVYKGKILDDDSITCCNEGLSRNAELMCLVSERPNMSGPNTSERHSDKEDFGAITGDHYDLVFPIENPDRKIHEDNESTFSRSSMTVQDIITMSEMQRARPVSSGAMQSMQINAGQLQFPPSNLGAYDSRLTFDTAGNLCHFEIAERGSISSSSSSLSGNNHQPVTLGCDKVEKSGQCPHPECGRVFKDLEAHMLTHQSERPEKCPIVTCDYHTKGFARAYDRKRHTLTHYKGTMLCFFCPINESRGEKSFNRVDVFKRHLTSVHGVHQSPPNAKSVMPIQQHLTGGPASKCSTCSSTFSDAQNFYDHLDDCVLKFIEQRLQEIGENPGRETAETSETSETFEVGRIQNEWQTLFGRAQETGRIGDVNLDNSTQLPSAPVQPSADQAEPTAQLMVQQFKPKVAGNKESPTSTYDTDANTYIPTLSDLPSERSYARRNELYNEGPKKDGLYHCPFEADGCKHKPEKLKCNYE